MAYLAALALILCCALAIYAGVTRRELARHEVLEQEAFDALMSDKPTPDKVEDERATALVGRVADLEAEVRSLTRRLTDAEDSMEHRFRRLNARSKREESTDTETVEDAAQVRIPFGAAPAAPVTRSAFGAPNGRAPWGQR